VTHQDEGKTNMASTESRIVRLVKQFGADEAQAMLALDHLGRAIAPQTPGQFLTKGLRAKGLGSSGLTGEINFAMLENLGCALKSKGLSWQDLAEAAEEPALTDAETFASAFAGAFSGFEGIFNAPGTPMAKAAAAKEEAAKPVKPRYGRYSMPPLVSGKPAISYDGTLRNGTRMIRFRLISDGFTLMTELVAFGHQADEIAKAANDVREVMLSVDVPEDDGKFPVASIF
jgi:hypothetical protein